MVPVSCSVISVVMTAIMAPAPNNLTPPAPIRFIPIIMTSATVGNTSTPIKPIQTPATIASALRFKISLLRGSAER
ncbi:hypothetical protein D3C78_1281050 [compost metagenome]